MRTNWSAHRPLDGMKGRHLPNPLFAQAITWFVLKGNTFRNLKTGETVIGQFSSFLTSELRWAGWRNIGRPVDVENAAEEQSGLRVINTYGDDWEEKASEWRSSTGWRKVKRYSTIVVADDKFIAGRAG